jgi:hypothetical protein
MGNVLDMYAHSLEAAARKGDVGAEGYVKTRAFLDTMKKEGVTQAIDAFARGDYDGGMALYNGLGQMNGARVVGAEEGTTVLPTGQTVPTRRVTIANADGSRAVVDTTLDRYKMIGLEKQVEMMDKAAAQESLGEYHTGMAEAAKQNADTQEQYRKDQATNASRANEVRLQVGTGRNAGKAAALDTKAVNEALKLNAHLYSYTPDSGEKDVVLPAAKSLYGNMIVKLGDPDKAYAVMDALKTEAMKSAANPETGVVDQAAFLKNFNASVAAADARMRQGTAVAKPAAAAPAKAPAAAPAAKPAAPPAAPRQEGIVASNDYLIGGRSFSDQATAERYLQLAKSQRAPWFMRDPSQQVVAGPRKYIAPNGRTFDTEQAAQDYMAMAKRQNHRL